MNPAQAPADFRTTNEIFETEVIGKRNFAALDRVYTNDARILPPGAPMIVGRENIRAFWQTAVEALNATGGRLESLEINVAGDTAVEIGRATVESDQATLDVKYVVVWKREDNAWKWHIDIWNTNV
jgi:ketosteroid isomerase-like protein